MSGEPIKGLRSILLCSLAASISSALLYRVFWKHFDFELRPILFLAILILLNSYSYYLSVNMKNPPQLFKYFYFHYDGIGQFVKFNITLSLFYLVMTALDKTI